MKIILLADHPQWGKRGEERDVPEGFVRNFLLPRKLAVLATPKEKEKWEQQRSRLLEATGRTRKEAEELRSKLEGAAIEISAKAGEKGKLFGSVTAEGIVEVIQKKIGVQIDKHKIKLGAPIHMIGEHRVPIKLHAEVVANILVKVIGE